MKSLPKIHIINIILFTILVCSVFVKVYFTDKSSILGKELANLDKNVHTLEKQNEVQKNEYLNLVSLSSLSKRAYDMGLVNSNVEYYHPNNLALR